MSSHYAQLADWSNAMTEYVMVYRNIPAEKRAEPIDGGWSARQILQHLMETEIIFSSRMRTAIANPGGSLLPFDPDLYEARIPNDEVPDDLLLDALAALRSVNISLLRALPDEAWNQTVQHPEVGQQTLERIVGIFGNHVTNHLNDMKNAGLGVRAL
jgi:uncharacterized damage-inducible protein DinB